MLLVLGMGFSLKAQPAQCLEGLTPQNMYSKSYAGWIGMDAIEYRDANGIAKGYVIAGANDATSSWSTGYPALIQTDLSGNIIDSKAYLLDPTSTFRAYAVVQTFSAAGDPTGFAFIASLNQPSVFNNGGVSAKVVQVDNNLAVVWEKTFKGNGKDAFTDLIVDGDRNLVVVGHTNSAGHGGYDVTVTKLSENGQLIWNNTYGAPSHEFAYDIAEDRFGGYAICGATSNLTSRQCMLLHIDDNGNQDFMKYYGNASESHLVSGFALTQTRTGWAITGTTGGNSSRYPFLVVTDALGDYVSGYRYHASGVANGIGVGIRYYQPSNTCVPEYFITGSYNQEAFTMKTNGLQINAWRQILNPNPTNAGFEPTYNNSINGVGETRGNGFIMTGHANQRIWVVKTGSYGYRYGCLTGSQPAPTPQNLYTIAWTYTLGFNPMAGVPVVAANAYDFNWDSDVVSHCFVKPDKEARLKTAAPLEIAAGLEAFPNPNNGRFTLSLSADQTEGQTVSMFDLSGKQVGEVSIEPGQSMEVSLEGLPSGLYLARSSSGQTLKISVR